MTFFNTTHLSGVELSTAIGKCKKQEERVLLIMKWIGEPSTPEQVWTRYNQWVEGNTPITSIRRAITNLTNQGKLEKTTLYAYSRYGAINYKWKLI